MTKHPISIVLLTAIAAAACDGGPRSTEPARTQIPEKESSAKDWKGRWLGPEGTYLELNENGGRYQVIVSNLDGPRTFDATVTGNVVTFVRDGVPETVRAGNGVDTGMKWLVDKNDCLVVKAGEGYCRE